MALTNCTVSGNRGFGVSTIFTATLTNCIVSGNTGGGDTQWGIRVVIGGSSTDWYGAGAGGVAYIGSFIWSTDTPTFVFEEKLFNGYEKYTAEAISHEVLARFDVREVGVRVRKPKVKLGGPLDHAAVEIWRRHR